jgi:hypothetical protein
METKLYRLFKPSLMRWQEKCGVVDQGEEIRDAQVPESFGGGRGEPGDRWRIRRLGRVHG